MLEATASSRERDDQNLENRVEAGLQLEALLDNRDQDVDRDGDPDLGLHRVLGGSVERLDVQVLLNPFEEQLHLPAAAV